MEMKNLIAKIVLGVTLVASFVGFTSIPTVAASGRDCDTNAVIKCGALTTSELATRINNGGSGPNQSAWQLKTLFAHYDISTADFSHLKSGYVTKSGQVHVDGKIVKYSAKSIGRHDIAGSSKLTFVNYPLYIRPTTVSFVSSTIDAFVYMNSDGSMAYAILKPCGNIVPGVGKRIPTPPTPPVPTPLYKAYALKWIDANGNGVMDSNETLRQAGVYFDLSGNGITEKAVSDTNGYAYFSNLTAGSYTITEEVPDGYTSTTGTTKTLVVTKDDEGVLFGNEKIVPKPELVSLTVKKFNDCNGDKIQDNGEGMLSGWSFKVTGPNGFEKTVTTGADGTVTLSDLTPGTYTVTEVLQDGWDNTTGVTQTFDITKEVKTHCYTFGNKQKETPPVKPTPEQPVIEQGKGNLPASGPAEAAAGAAGLTATGGAAYAWMRSKKALLAAISKVK